MLVDEMPRSFVKKNNSYSHCPLKKRPVTVMLSEDVPDVKKGKHRVAENSRKFRSIVREMGKKCFCESSVIFAESTGNS